MQVIFFVATILKVLLTLSIATNISKGVLLESTNLIKNTNLTDVAMGILALFL